MVHFRTIDDVDITNGAGWTLDLAVTEVHNAAWWWQRGPEPFKCGLSSCRNQEKYDAQCQGRESFHVEIATKETDYR